MRYWHNKSGSVLLYSLLIISLITAISITVSIIVVNELKLTTGAADATLAYYAAESGIERGLHEVKIIRSNPGIDLTTAITTIGNFTSVANNFSNNAEYTNDQTASQTSEIKDKQILRDKFIQADYYDVDDPLHPVAGKLAKYIIIQNTGGDNSAWADVSWVAWDDTGSLGYSDSARKIIGHTDLNSGWPIDLAGAYSNLNPRFSPAGYRVRIKALSGNLDAVTAEPYTDALPGGTLIADLPSQLVIKSVGKRSNFKQSLTATVPWKLPLSGLYDYVLFSESDILKTIILSRQAYSSGVIQVEKNLTVAQCNCSSDPICASQSPAWLGTGCVGTTCTIAVGSGPSYCSLPAANNNFTLPLPDYVPVGEEYYVSLRVRPTINTSEVMEVLVDDPEQGQVGLTLNYSRTGTEEWKACTIAEPVILSAGPGRLISFENRGASPVDVDWYQISSYKIFGDCQ